jgi:ribosomal protein S4E
LRVLVVGQIRVSQTERVKTNPLGTLRDGAPCKVTGGTHAGKSGTVRDIKASATGHVTITVVQANGDRFKTLAKNVLVG